MSKGKYTSQKELTKMGDNFYNRMWKSGREAQEKEAVDDALLATAEYMGFEKKHVDVDGFMKINKVFYFRDGKRYCQAKDWIPHIDMNQLKMVLKKLRKEKGGYGLLIEAEGKGGVSCSMLMGTNNTDARHEDESIAILLCIAKAIGKI